MTGQDAVRSADEFHSAVGITGIVLTKLDGDARGGAALSHRGHRPPSSSRAWARRWTRSSRSTRRAWSSRILGMGDVLALIERAEETVDQEKAEELVRKLRSAGVLARGLPRPAPQIRKMGSLEQVLSMIPGMRRAEGPTLTAASERCGAGSGDHRLDDAPGAARPPRYQWQPPKRIARERQPGRGRQPAAQAVRADEEDGEGARRGVEGHGESGLPLAELPLRGEKIEGMLAIRLRRTGSTKRPYYRVAVADCATGVTAASSRCSATTTRAGTRRWWRSTPSARSTGSVRAHRPATRCAACSSASAAGAGGAEA